MCRDKYSGSKKSPNTVDNTATPDEPFQDANMGEVNILSSSLAEEIRLLRVEMASARSEMTSFRQEIAQLNLNMADFNKRVDAVEVRVSQIEQQIANNNVTENTTLVDTIDQLKADLNDREQEELLNDIEIAGVPENSGENVVHLTSLIIKKIGIDINENDVVSADRKGPKRDGDRHRHRSIKVRLARRALRDDILRAARVRRGADTSGVLDGKPQRIYINEHLTRTNRLLFYQAREEGRSRNWRFIWTRGGRIYARQDAGSHVQRIRTESDIKRIFCSSPIRH